jgi:hypothetical protein
MKLFYVMMFLAITPKAQETEATRGIAPNHKLLHTKESKQKNEETNYRVRENIVKPF